MINLFKGILIGLIVVLNGCANTGAPMLHTQIKDPLTKCKVAQACETESKALSEACKTDASTIEAPVKASCELKREDRKANEARKANCERHNKNIDKNHAIRKAQKARNCERVYRGKSQRCFRDFGLTKAYCTVITNTDK